MPKHPRAEVVDYVAKILKSKPDTSYADVVKEGRSKGYHVYPLIRGLAKNTLGMGRKKGPGRPKGRKPGRPVGSGARRGRPPAGVARGFTADLVRGIERMQSDVAAMRSALHDIARL